MNIRDLMEAQKKNEEVRESHEQRKRWLLPASVLFLGLFAAFIFLGKIQNGGHVLFFLVGIVLVIYFFYIGLSSWLVCYVRRRGNAVYRGQNLFLLRQFSSKLKTMSFTMGTLTALFTVAFLGCTVAMMFSDYQNKILETKFPFDVQINSADTEDDFADELEVIEESAKISEAYPYHIYARLPKGEQGSANGAQADGRIPEESQVNIWLSTHLKTFGRTYLNEDGSPNLKKIAKDSGQGAFYCKYDTYMKLSDYNRLRSMLGYPAVSLGEHEYLIHLKERIRKEAGNLKDDITIRGNEGELQFAGYYAEPFSQDGHNGGDYVIVVPDSQEALLTPYYSELAVDIEGEAPLGLGNKLDNIGGPKSRDDTGVDEDFAGHKALQGNICCGSDTIVVMSVENMVRDNLIPETKYMLSSLIFPCFYIGLVFLCVALTVLSVQQLSDSAKYKFRYSVLKKLGMNRQEIGMVILKQLVCYYLCPVFLAAVIGGSVSVFMSGKFIFYTGIRTAVINYFGLSFLLFFGIYALYFITTYVSFRRNVEV